MGTDLLDVLKYPLRGIGWLTILIAGAMGMVVFVIANLGMVQISRLSIAVGVALLGLVGAYLLQVVQLTVEGQDALPDLPGPAVDLTDEYLVPAALLLALLALCGAPLGVLYVADVQSPGTVALALLAGLACFPLGLAGLAVGAGFAVLSPRVLVASVTRLGLGYVALLAPALILMAVGYLALPGLSRSPWTAGFVLCTTGTYLLVAQARLAGLLYVAHEDELDWFE